MGRQHIHSPILLQERIFVLTQTYQYKLMSLTYFSRPTGLGLGLRVEGEPLNCCMQS